jgi:Mg2+-importing ATPase
VDIAKQTADLVLLDKDLAVLADGVEYGRRIFSNTLKYVQVTTSANFGNMLSLAITTTFLPFLPLLPLQILLLNFMSDVPGLTIATDRVDDEQIVNPQRWDIAYVKRFMIVFGLASTAFDLVTFAILRYAFDANETELRSGWFVLSTLTELAAMLILRTRRPFFKSKPGTALLISSGVVGMATVALPYSPLAQPFGLAGPSMATLASLAAVLIGYVTVSELLKLRAAGRWHQRTSQA